MQLFVSALIVGAIFMANSMSRVEGLGSLYSHCYQVSKLLDMNEEPIPAYERAEKYLRPKFSGCFSNQDRLLDAWQAVAHDEPCTSKSHELVDTIRSCGAFEHPSLKNPLGKATIRYTNKCFPDAAKLDDVLRTQLEGLSGKDSAELTELLDDQFIAKFRLNDARDSRYVSVRSICCMPDKSEESIVDSIKRWHEKKAQNAASYFKQSPRKISTFLEHNLIKPCKKYVKQMNSLMGMVVVLQIANRQEKGTWYLDNLSQDFQNAIFRYQFCERMKYSVTRKIVTSFVANHFS